MKMTESLRKFIRDHAEDDPSELLLNVSRYQDVDIKTSVIQIKARKQIKDKLPEWYKDDRLFFPSTLAAEQCSSEITALYKKRLLHQNDWLCDLTGGLGVDSFYLAQKIRHVTYIEKNKVCCDTAQANFSTLGATNIHVINEDAIAFLKNKDEYIAGINTFYIDPARRGTGNKRLYAISDCEPDLKEIIDLLPTYYKLIIKLSPMLDITKALKQIPSVREVHILSVKNECKELLFVVESNPCNNTPKADPVIFCINYQGNNVEQSFCFRLSDERVVVAPMANNDYCTVDRARLSVDAVIAPKAEHFLYEPNASILKAGAYKSVAWRYGVEKIHTNSHLYTSKELVMTFPGRIFEITEVFPFNNRICKTISSVIPQANITVRNFPLTVDEVRKRTRINDGGDVYLFATTLPDNKKALIKCHKVAPF